MKKRVLLVDESLTVQKVVALTLDKSRYAVTYAKSRSEAMKLTVEHPPHLILVSDQVADINVGSFPREVESWLQRRTATAGGAKGSTVPPILLVTAQDLKEVRQYAGVLRKPFSPQALQKLVDEHSAAVPEESAPSGPAPQPDAPSEDLEDQRLQKIFNDAFADEAKLVRETFEGESETLSQGAMDPGEVDLEAETMVNIPVLRPDPPAAKASPPPAATEVDDWAAETPVAPAPAPRRASDAKAADLWGPPSAVPAAKSRTSGDVLGSSDSHAYKAILENQVESQLGKGDLEAVVERVLDRLLPSIVERHVQERLDKLLKEQEQFMELKP